MNGARVDAWACVNFSMKLSRNVPGDFCNEVINMCNSKGMEFNPRPILDIKFANPNQIERALADVHEESMARLASMNLPQKQLQLLIIILPDEDGSHGGWVTDEDGSYGRIKRMCATELGLVSQCCRPSPAANMRKRYCENVATKIKIKFGRRNSVLNDVVGRSIPVCPQLPFRDNDEEGSYRDED